MTILLIVMLGAFCIAAITKFVLARPWRARIRLLALSLSFVPLPAFAWWMAFNSLGSGWGFGLIAFAQSAIFSFGVGMGWLWHSDTRPI